MITILKKPEKFTPSGNPVIWQIETDNADILYFKVSVYENSTNTLINSLDIYPTPDLQNGSYVDLSKLLDNAVNWEVSNDIESFAKGLSKPVIGYRVKIEEKVIVNNSVVTGATYEDVNDVNYVFSANLENIAFNYFDHNEYVVKSSNTNVKFLTYKPDFGLMNKATTEFLHFMTDGSEPIQVQTIYYNADGTVNDTFLTPVTGDEKMFRLNIAYKALKNEFSLMMTDGMSISFKVVDMYDNPKTEKRTYLYKDVECHLEMVNVLFLNSFNCVDAYQFVNPTESLNATRTSIKKNPYNIDGDGNYTNTTDDMYNVSDEVLNSSSQLTVKVHTRILKDKEVFWLGELVTSRQWFIELSDMMLVPVTLLNNTYTYQRQRYLKGNVNVMQFDLQFARGFIPTLSFGDASYIVQSEFQNKEYSQVFYNSTCGEEYQGAPYVFTVPAGMFTSEVSQTDAQNQAIAYANTNGQADADVNGGCVLRQRYWNDIQSGTFYKNCPEGEEDAEGYDAWIAAGIYYSYISVEDANAIAYDALVSEGEAMASLGTCTVITSYGNAQMQSTFYSTTCPVNSDPEPYVYIVPANTFFASTQEEANQLAVDDLINGQAEADLNGGCSPVITTINLFVTIREELVGSMYKNVYFTVHSNAQVTDNITVGCYGVDDTMAQFVVPNAYMYAGSWNSGEEFAGQYDINNPFQLPTEIHISSVSPNPDSMGTTYTW